MTSLSSSNTNLILSMTITAIITSILYSHSQSNLSGPWMLDDIGTVTRNPLVTEPNRFPWSELWKRDFWGHDDLTDAKSHKSWRPICTASYRLQKMWLEDDDDSSGGSGENGEGENMDPYWFHVVDRVLHGVVTALTIPVGLYTLRLTPPQSGDKVAGWGRCWKVAWTTAFFAVHPVHVEAVANTTGRAEVLCAMFYLLGFWGYGRLGVGLRLDDGNGGSSSLSLPVVFGWRRWLGCGLGVVWMALCTAASMLCKEHGVTLPIMCVVWDAYVGTATSVPELIQLLRSNHTNTLKKDTTTPSEPTDTNTQSKTTQSSPRRLQCCHFLLRTILATLLTITLALYRLSKNGPSTPHLVCEQNPAACLPSPLLRTLHFGLLWAINFWILICPTWLSPDWSGDSVPLMEVPETDPRFIAVVGVVVVILWVVRHAVSAAWLPIVNDGDDQTTTITAALRRRRTVLTCFIWMFLPFVMSSNLVVYVGFVVADRTLYLPSFGFCLLLVEGLLLLPQYILTLSSTGRNERRGTSSRIPSICAATVILILYTIKQQVQTTRWSDPVLLWGEAYRINPNSCINGVQYGMALVNAQRNRDAAKVLTRGHRIEMNSKRYIASIEDGVGTSSSNDAPSLDRERSSLSNLMTTRFKLVTAMGNSGDCVKAQPLIEDGLMLVRDAVQDIEEELKNMNGSDEEALQEAKSALMQNMSFLSVARSRCATDIPTMGQYAYDAVVANPGFDYAMAHATSVNSVVENIRKAGVEPKDVLLSWKKSADGQTANLEFAYNMQ